MVVVRSQKQINALLALLAWNGGRRAFAFGSLPTTATQIKVVPSMGRGENSLQRRWLHGAAILPRQRQAAGALESASVNAGSIAVDDGANEKRLPKKRLAGAATLISTLLIIKTQPAVSKVFSSALRAYESSLIDNPLPTKVATGASLAVIGDYLAQAKEGKDGYDVPRAVSFAVFDSCYRMFQHVAIPTIVKYGQGLIFLSILSKLPLLNPTVAFTAAMERTFLYQFVLIPFFYYPIFFTFTGAIQGLSLKEILDRARVSFLPCWKRNLLFWIPTQMVMFGLVAERWQIPFVCVMGILWSLILSVTAGKAKQE